MIVRMWEVKAHPEAHHDLLTWVCEIGVPRLEAEVAHISSEVFTSTDHRVVVISKWRGYEPRDLPDPPGHYVRRAPHVWDFTPVDR
ncbi:MAG: hypothetical protein JWO79_2406 [Actinomycetia bacterium]|nr:hypothetical protein [Actinomycetes bacterium]MDQ1651468.1 hypothetical protein [Cryptosporangiaceae bacterium]MDQ1659948.1 hypothetical protein [Cryptosporangiaceae bacterium]